MIEKTITLEDVPLIDFLGTENRNMRAISRAFPASKIISRGQDIKIIGKNQEVDQIDQLIFILLEHFHRYGKISPEIVESYVARDVNVPVKHPEKIALVHGIGGNPIKARTPNQQAIVDACNKNDLVFAVGPAGTGKTYVAVALAVRALKNKQVKKVIISRPAVEAGENLGFLPGDLKEKVDPYLRPVYDALTDMIPGERLKALQEAGTIEIAPLAYMRGRTLENAFVLLDEAQNTTSMQMRMFLTRLGKHSKMIITGDPSQIDLPRNQKSGLVEALHVLHGIKDISIIRLEAEDVVRHKVVKRIIDAYNKQEEDEFQ